MAGYMIGNQEYPFLDMDRFNLMPTQPTNPVSFGTPTTPNADLGLGLNMPTAKLALGGIATLGNLWGAFQANKLAKKQFAASKEFANANLNNSISAYNTALEDRARSRAAMEGQSAEQAAAYVEQNRLRR